MKPRSPFYLIPFTLLIIISISGCTNAPGPESALKTYSDDAISFSYPDWPDAATKDLAVFMLKAKGSCAFSAARYPVSSIALREELGRRLGMVFQAEGNEEYEVYSASYVMNAGGTGYNAITRLTYCDYASYTLTLACSGETDAVALSDLGSLACNYEKAKTVPKLGLFPIPKNDNSSLIIDAIKESRAIGAEVLPWYLAWKDAGVSWNVTDLLIEPLAYEGKTALSVNIIHSNVLGGYPDGFEHFADAGFKEAFARFSIDFVRRYKPDYYLIGGEVDIYLSQHRSEIPAFREFLQYVYAEIKKAEPGQRVGYVVTYHDAVKNNATDIIRTLEPYSDIVVYTVHSYEGQFDYTNVSRGLAQLSDVKNVLPGKPYAIIETGWSSSAMLGSSEEKQAAFARDFFSFIEATDAEFVTWFGLYEWSDCTEAAETFLAPIPEENRDPVFVSRFEEFMCSLGLNRYDGTPKKAFGVWQENVNSG